MLFSILCITLEHTITPEQQAQGLMYRKSMPENHGMTFSFDSPRKLTFWSKNCCFDIDLAFLNCNHVIQEIYLLKAHPTQRITSKLPAQYVVEMNAGFFEKNGVRIGDSIVWESCLQSAMIIPQEPVCSQKF